MRKKTICWFIDVASMILFVVYFGRDAISPDKITDLISRGKDESRRYRETAPTAEFIEPAAAIEGGADK